jgi:hypothetical protein
MSVFYLKATFTTIHIQKYLSFYFHWLLRWATSEKLPACH